MLSVLDKAKARCEETLHLILGLLVSWRDERYQASAAMLTPQLSCNDSVAAC